MAWNANNVTIMTRKPEPQPRRAYRVSEVAEMLGVTPKTIYRWIDKGLLKGVRVRGMNVMIPAPAVEKMLKGER